jgi:ankyrin repeat protein
VVQLLLDRGAKVNAQGNCFHWLLSHRYSPPAAVSHDDVKLSLEKGARVNDQSNVSHGVPKTPLITAVSKENVEIVRLLLDHDANVDSYGNVAP